MTQTKELGRLRVEQLGPHDLLALLRANSHLVQAMSYPSFFCSPGWLGAVLQSGEPREPFGLVVFRGETAIAVLPLQAVRNCLGGRDLRFLGYRFYPDPLGLICAARDLREAIAPLVDYLQRLSDWDRLILDCVLFSEASHWPGKAQAQSFAPYCTLPATFDELIGQFSSEKRYKLRSKMRRAEKARLEFTVAESATDRSRLLGALFELHGRRSLAIDRASSLQNDHVRDFHSRVVADCPEARLFALTLASKVIAVTYGFLSNERFAFYQIAHDPDYDNLRPGTVLLAKTIAYACDADAIEFNFLQGKEGYKFEWARDVRGLLKVRVCAARLRPVLLNHAENARTGLGRILRNLQ